MGTLHYSGKHYSYRTLTSSKLLNCENLLPWENIVIRVPSIWLRTPSESVVRVMIVSGFVFGCLQHPREKAQSSHVSLCSRSVCEWVKIKSIRGEDRSRCTLITKITADSSSLFHYHLISWKYQCRHKPWSFFCHSSLFT